MQKHNSKIRKANALAAALLTAFFLAHALLGAFSRLFLNADAPTIIVWAFIFVAFVHIANALAAALLTAFFLAHALLGAFSRLFLNADAPTIIVWAFIFVAFVHIALCLITSRLMLTDTVRPPSRKKKNHLWLKWASGAALAACAAPHALGWDASARWFTLLVLALLAWHAYIGCKSLARDLASGAALAACAAPHALGWDASARWFTLLVLALLAWHAYIGCKSLARDLDMRRGAKTPLRITIIAASCVIGAIAATSLINAS